MSHLIKISTPYRIDWAAARKKYKASAWDETTVGWKISDNLCVIRHDCAYYAEHNSKGILHKSDRGVNNRHNYFKAYKSKNYAIEAAISELNPTEGIEVYSDILIY